MRKYRKFQDVLRDDPAKAYAYLQVALEEFDQDVDTEHLMLALRNVAEARGGVQTAPYRFRGCTPPQNMP